MTGDHQTQPSIEARFHWNRRLVLHPGDNSHSQGRLRVAIEQGTNCVAVVRREKAAGKKTYDTGAYEELYLEFKNAPSVRGERQARDLIAAAFYQYGSSVLIYQSRSFDGTVKLNAWKPGELISADCNLHFSEPSFDRVKVSIVEVTLNF